MWSGWTGAPLSTVSLKWWGFERDFHGEEMVVRDGYSALIDWTAREIVNAQTKGNSEIKLNTKVTSARLSEEGGCWNSTSIHPDCAC